MQFSLLIIDRDTGVELYRNVHRLNALMPPEYGVDVFGRPAMRFTAFDGIELQPGKYGIRAHVFAEPPWGIGIDGTAQLPAVQFGTPESKLRILNAYAIRLMMTNS